MKRCIGVVLAAGLCVPAGLGVAAAGETAAREPDELAWPSREPGGFAVPPPEPDRLELPSASSWKQRDDRPYWRQNLFTRFLGDQKYLVTAWWPAEARQLEFSIPLGLAVVGAAGSSDPARGVDLRWQRSIEDWTTGGRRDAAEAFSRLGDRSTGFVLVGGVYLLSRWTGNERAERAASLSAEALLTTGLYSGMLKRLSRRARPGSAGDVRFDLDAGAARELNSFPSGHAAGAFAVATVVAWEYRDERWVPWVAYGAAGLIALSRVGLGRHYPSDVLAGAVLGRSIGRMVIHRSGGGGDESGAKFEPLFEPRSGGIGIGYRRTW